MNVSWQAPATGSDVTSYLLQYRPKGSTEWTTLTLPGTTLSTTITGLSAGTEYEFQVAALNEVGTSATAANTSSVVAAATPANVVEAVLASTGQSTWLLIGVASLLVAGSTVVAARTFRRTARR